MAKLIQYSTKASLYDGPFGEGVGWAAAGMGYILQTDNGRLIVIDGGFADDAEEFLSLLERCAGDSRPEVDLWIITHPHGDHYGVPLRISQDPALSGRVAVREFVYHLPTDFKGPRGYGEEDVFRDFNLMSTLSGGRIHTPKVDERLCVDGMELHFLYTPTDCTILNDPNQLSLIFTAATPRKKLMITGDAHRRNMQIVLWRYPGQLKCDILQLPHHGLCDTGLETFYREVDAETVLVPISIAGDRAMNNYYYADNAPNRFAAENADQVFKACDGTVEIEM